MILEREPHPYTMWCFGLSEEDMACISECAGDECVVVSRDISVLHNEVAYVQEDPALMWVHDTVWNKADVGALKGTGSTVPKVLVAKPQASADDLDAFIEADAEHVLRSALTKPGVYRILRRTLEVCSIHQDMGRMTREILMHREMMNRKEDVLQFIFDAEAKLAAVQTIPQILVAMREGLSGLLPVRQMHTVLWRPGRARQRAEVYFDGTKPHGKHAEAWRAVLLDAVQRVSGAAITIKNEECFFIGSDLAPDAGHLLLLAMKHGNETVGLFLFLLSCDVTLSRDQNQALTALLSRAASLVCLAHGGGQKFSRSVGSVSCISENQQHS